uniref:Receptor-like protein 12 n=1 Tax=Nicotiana tabacum TaxID=4097 RepID=A0A1S4BTD6_TOBAC|nr:PREDICTED: receptor-like protein 12 [Nicotiana tabacum]
MLEGKVPRSLERCAYLEVFDIGNNKIRDTFPCMLKKLFNLHVLVLRSNMFYGNLKCPIANQTWPRLQIIDLASNNFNGYLLPQYLSNLEKMMPTSKFPEPEYLIVKVFNYGKYYLDRVTVVLKGREMEIVKILAIFTSIDFSCNNFQGEIPEVLGDLKFLYLLNLSHNALTGRISKALGKLTQLESLDLSVNQLIGRIPDELVGLTFLSFLNLSFNQLSGRIPRGNQFQTFSVDSFEGNTGLCYFPLKKTCSDIKVNGLSQPSSHSEHEIDGKYISFALGSSVCFGIVTWLLLHAQDTMRLLTDFFTEFWVSTKRMAGIKTRGGQVPAKIICCPLLSSFTVLVVFLISSNISPVYGHCLRDQKALLLKLKNGLTFDSSLSTKLDRWDQNTDCCQWPGVSCDQKGHVLVLELDNETISGGVENSSSLFDLKYLEKMNLAYNQLDAVQIPIEIYKLKNLTYLNFSYAGFDGQIPMELSRLTQLVFLDLSYNYFLKLESPDLKILVGNLTNLEELYLDDVNIYMNGTEWCWALSSSLLKLRVLSMTRCGISGPLDPILLKLHYLAVIRLDHNDMSTIDLELLDNFTKLTTLSLMSCNLRCSFPSKIIQVPALQVLDLSYNENLIGNLPEFPQKSALRELVLRHTGFTGSLPNSIANLENMARLNLRSCNFSGHIPSNLGNLTDLIHLDLSFNNFTGSIPLFHKAKKLNHIDLSNNNGPLSSTQTQLSVLLSLPSLQFLSIQNSHLRGKVHEFSNASSSVLETLDLSNNHLNGSIPRSIFKLKRLSELSLSSNSFSGTINIEAIKGLPKLTALELSYNNLRIDIHESNSTSFPFPVEISNLRLASCQLQKFPDLKNQSLLSGLDLSDNNIKGKIPSWVWTVGYLNLSHNLLESLEKPYNISTTPRVIDLSSNRIKGNPPFLRADSDHFANWTSSITYLSLANNKLTGSIPSSICNLDELQFLDMSNNSINSKIPPCLFQKLADRLVVLNIGRNKLSGIIPDTFR